MTDTPKGYHDAEVWLQVEGKTRAVRLAESDRHVVVDGIKVKRLTQSRPNPPDRGCIAVKVTLRIPDGAFLPFSPEAVITVPENMVVRGPIDADVAGAGEIPHPFFDLGVEDEQGIRRCTHASADGVCDMPEADPIHTKDD